MAVKPLLALKLNKSCSDIFLFYFFISSLIDQLDVARCSGSLIWSYHHCILWCWGALLDQSIIWGRWLCSTRRLQCICPLLSRLVAAWINRRTCRHVTDVVLIVFGRDYLQVSHDERVCVPLALEELSVVLNVVDTWENFLKVAQSKLLFLEIENDLQIVFSNKVLFTLKQLPHKFAEISVWR